jgi:hypothetical protein
VYLVTCQPYKDRVHVYATAGVVSRSDLHNLHGETGGRTVGDIMTAPPVW